MLATESQDEMIQATWAKILSQLEEEKKRIYAEIANYPPPIPACDAQFNYLLEQRAQIAEELHQARDASRQQLAYHESIQTITTFVQTSVYMNSEQGQLFIAGLSEALLEPTN